MPVVVAEVLREIAKNTAMSVPAIRKRRLSRPRAGVRFTGQDDELETYAFFSLRLLRATVGDIRGKRVLEIGPGDFLTSGMSLLAGGAETYTSIDRFAGDYSRLEGKDWYAGIQAAWPRLHPELPWPSWLDAAAFPEAYGDRVRALNVPVESATNVGEFDIVCSFQVGEHVTDIEAFARASAVLLAPNGRVVHRIDFGPHGGWRRFDDPLTFLRIPEPLWQLTGTNRGVANRHRLHEFVAAFEASGLRVTVESARRLNLAEDRIRALPRRFRGMPHDSLDTLDAVLVCEHA